MPHTSAPVSQAPLTELNTLALLGNPNTGKSSLFNALTGLSQHIGNYPGVTVERRTGTLKLGSREINLVDLPGTYGLYPKSADERIACAVLQQPADADHPDAVLVVADANNLKPSLLLCTQVLDLGYPSVLVLNMADQLERRGALVNTQVLQRLLGIPVVLLSALKRTGLDALKKILQSPLTTSPFTFFRIPESFLPQVRVLRSRLSLGSDYAAYKYLLEAGAEDVVRLREQMGITQPAELIGNELLVRYDGIQGMLTQALERNEAQRVRHSEQLDKILLHRVWGYVVLIGLLLLVFQAIFTWASLPMDWIDGGMAALGSALQQALPEGWLRALVVNGLIAGIQGVVVFIPQIALLFLFIAVLEESGYMSRVVFLMDRLMRPLGLSGKSVVPLLGGFACAVPSIMGARTIAHPRERLLTIMITPLMSCSARIPVYTVLIAVFVPADTVYGFFDLRGLAMAGFYVLGIAVAIFMALVVKYVSRKQEEGLFITELPNYRMPRWRNVGLEIYNKTSSFVLQAGKVILIMALVLWFLASFGPPGRLEHIEETYTSLKKEKQLTPAELATLDAQAAAEKLQHSWAGVIGKFVEPVIKPLGYDWKIGIALISSFAAREVFVGTMNTLYSLGAAPPDAEGYGRLTSRLRAEKNEQGQPVYTTAVALSLLVFYALAMQCMSTLAVVKRETGGWKWAIVMLLYQTGLAYVLALATYQVFA